MLITEMEMIGLVRAAVLHTAAKVKVTNSEWKTSEELLTDIAAKDAQTYKLLDAFLAAYWAWFNFHKHIEATGKQGNLDRDEHEQLAQLVGRRNSTREMILHRLQSLP